MKLVSTAAAGTTLAGCNTGRQVGHSGSRGRVFVLAFDGMDPRVLRGLMKLGQVPNFSRLADLGGFTKITSSLPPQTPVAFSDVISGADCQTHQIFDFIHRDLTPPGELSVLPFFSSSHVETPETEMAIRLGSWKLPLNGQEPKLLRKGSTYWESLLDQGHDAAVYYAPSNYPPAEPSGTGNFECLSGMGTPDLLGGYGNFTVFTPDVGLRGRQVPGGGRFVYANLGRNSDEVILKIEGPNNFLHVPDPQSRPTKMSIECRVVRDPERDVIEIEISGEKVVLTSGEWSRWVPIDFETGIPGSTVLTWMQAPTSLAGMLRFYVKSIHPKCELYVSPLNIDPVRPVNPISLPRGLSREIADRHGRYYTMGIPEDTKALDHGALNEDEFLSQAYLAHEERVEQYYEFLTRFSQGCLFFYFGSTDLVSHMFWRDRDPDHPGRKPEQGNRYANVIDELYIHMDQLVGDTLDRMHEEDTLVVFSDHGFNSFRRSVNLNTWLWQNGYLALKRPMRPGKRADLFAIDWSKTRAYALGINSLYINVRGREKNGIIAAGEQQEFIHKLASQLLDLRDADGTAPIRSVVPVAEELPNSDFQVAPDLIIGYADNYRVGWDTVLGGIPENVFEDNMMRWSGDHCIATDRVPGILLSNRKIQAEQPSLKDIGPSILNCFGIDVPPEMIGKSFFTT